MTGHKLVLMEPERSIHIYQVGKGRNQGRLSVVLTGIKFDNHVRTKKRKDISG